MQVASFKLHFVSGMSTVARLSPLVVLFATERVCPLQARVQVATFASELNFGKVVDRSLQHFRFVYARDACNKHSVAMQLAFCCKCNVAGMLRECCRNVAEMLQI